MRPTGGLKVFLKQKKAKAGISSTTLGSSRDTVGGAAGKLLMLLPLILTADIDKWQKGDEKHKSELRTAKREPDQRGTCAKKRR